MAVPSDISGLQIWLKADAGAGSVDGDAVGTWTDQSGTSHSFTQATGSKKPLYRTGRRNGLPAVVFDGTDDQLDGGDLSAVFTAAATMFMAVKPGNANGKIMPYESKNNDPWWRFTGGEGYWGLFRATRLAAVPGSGLAGTGNWEIWHMTADNGSNYKVWRDNVSVINSASAFTFDGGNAHILGYQATNNEYMTQDVGEMFAFDSVLSGTDLTNMWDYVNGRYGTIADGTATPSQVAGIGAVPAVVSSGQAKAAPSQVAGVGAVPAPTAFGTGSGIATPARVAGIGAVPAPTAFGAVAGTATPATVAAIGRVPRAIAEGEGTGGGGGTHNGATDFWSITLAS